MAKRNQVERNRSSKEVVSVNQIPDDMIGDIVIAELAQIEADGKTHPDTFAQRRILRSVNRLREIAGGRESKIEEPKIVRTPIDN